MYQRVTFLRVNRLFQVVFLGMSFFKFDHHQILQGSSGVQYELFSVQKFSIYRFFCEFFSFQITFLFLEKKNTKIEKLRFQKSPNI